MGAMQGCVLCLDWHGLSGRPNAHYYHFFLGCLRKPEEPLVAYGPSTHGHLQVLPASHAAL